MSLLKIPKRKPRQSEQSHDFAEQFAGDVAVLDAGADQSRKLSGKLETDKKPIELIPTFEAGATVNQENENLVEEAPTPVEIRSSGAEGAEDQREGEQKTSDPKPLAYKGERKKITGRYSFDVIARVDTIAYLTIEDRNSIIDRVLADWVAKEWKPLQKTKGRAEVDAAYGRAREALAKKRGT